jgi:CDP-diacylglycerol--glycerol-3-phosphate 3-phosphatidyltransferase
MKRKDLPNYLTIGRLILAVIFFAVLNQYRYVGPDLSTHRWALLAGIALFVIAAITDALDGYLARRWQVVSKFGRIMDPVADKLLVVGAFIYLAGPRFAIPHRLTDGDWAIMVSGVYPWMVVVVLLRELLVTTIRAEMESVGVKFPANVWGKLKMILQSIVVPIVLLLVWIDPLTHGWAAWLRDLLVWSTVIVTAISGLPYITRAVSAVRQSQPDG